MHGELLRVAREAGATLDHAGGGLPVEWPQAVGSGHRGQLTGEPVLRRSVAIRGVVEVGGDLEELGELRVELAQQVVDHPLANQHHLHVQRDRLRLQGYRLHQPERLLQRLDPDLA